MSEKKESQNIPTAWQYEKWISVLGKWTWMVILLIAVLYLLATIYTIGSYTISFIEAKNAWERNNPSSSYFYVYEFQPFWIWDLLSPIILAIFACNTLRVRFSKPCAQKDWIKLFDDVWEVGETRIPRMLIWVATAEIFGLGVAGLPILIISIILLYRGPQTYEWKK
ncbi:MAG: hypothetical protein JW891_10975 [Candidatus Lokiarchaeota archaeon]|nr:hypothetical protein [Candidatus Lokiarchaeota archaeon]